MEDILIPKLSVLMKYDKIFTDMSKFCAVTEYKPQSTFTEKTPVVKQRKQSVLSVSSVFRTLRNYILNTTRQDYNIINEEDTQCDTILSRDVQLELREKKNLLLNIIHKHEAAMANLREARIKCWKTQAKLEKYSLILATQRSSLLYNEHEKVVRQDVLWIMEKVFDQWMIQHNKDHIQFEKLFLHEIGLREKIQKISGDIESNISHMIYETIVQLMNRNNQIVGWKELQKLTNKLYQQACRVYIFQTVQNVPCNKQWIEKPTKQECGYKQDTVAKINHTKLTETCGQQDAEIVGKLSQCVS